MSALHLKRAANPRRRARVLLLGTVFVFSLFAAQLFRIQAFDAAATQRAAASKRELVGTIPAMRGRILDKNGVVLASSVEQFTVAADPVALFEYKKRRPPRTTTGPVRGLAEQEKAEALTATDFGPRVAAAKVAPLLGVPEADLVNSFTQLGTRYVPVAKGVSPETWRAVRALGIPGLSAEPTASRTYPGGFAGGSLVGFVLPADQSPGGGVEVLANDHLRGTSGKVVGEKAASGRMIPGSETVDQPAQNGRDVTLTLDMDLQYFATNAVAQQTINVDAESATAVVMEVETGKIRACATYPSFDPNDIAHANGPLLNRCFQESFEPGSTGKVMTMAAALEEKAVSPGTGVIIPNRLPRADTNFKDHEDHATEYLTAAGVLAKSSNIGTILIGERVKPTTMQQYYNKFGVARPTGVGWPGENKGLLSKGEEWLGSKRYTVLFGQGYSVNAVQAAGVFQTVANGGVRMPPSIIEGTTNAKGAFEPAPAVTGERVVSTQTANTVSRMLEEVTGDDGTAFQARIPGYRVAGKTGTADRYDEKLGRYNGFTASFIGYAPADKPKYVVAVIVQSPKQGMFGGKIAGPIYNQITRYLLEHDGIAPTGAEPGPMPVHSPKRLSEDDPAVLSDKQAKLAGL